MAIFNETYCKSLISSLNESKEYYEFKGVQVWYFKNKSTPEKMDLCLDLANKNWDIILNRVYDDIFKYIRKVYPEYKSVNDIKKFVKVMGAAYIDENKWYNKLCGTLSIAFSISKSDNFLIQMINAGYHIEVSFDKNKNPDIFSLWEYTE